ncbi:YqaJ viral recombinase family protein [Variovorax paradoxus]|uniref:YqaJ viral recombinase family protein n=1 Tax=Variovorax paradoxus TaxID=34073 RepID=UPI001932425F|nr:YqaJ viral recombinase family protein [Variovorax paradoxus]
MTRMGSAGEHAEMPWGIDSLDAPAALGFSPAKSPVRLWKEIVDRLDLSRPELGERVKGGTSSHWSRVIETLLRGHYAVRTGYRLQRTKQSRHAEHPWMLGGWADHVARSAQVELLMCLSVGSSEVALWCDEMPLDIRACALHELVVASAKAIDVMVLLGGRDLQVHRVRVEPRAVGELVAREAAFWECVQARRPPSADIALDSRVLLDLPIERIDNEFLALRSCS